jgi:hypothetical protein
MQPAQGRPHRRAPDQGIVSGRGGVHPETADRGRIRCAIVPALTVTTDQSIYADPA